MITREDAIKAEEEKTLLWLLETEPGGMTKAVSAVPSAVVETGVYFQSIYRSFADVFPTREAAALLVSS